VPEFTYCVVKVYDTDTALSVIM